MSLWKSLIILTLNIYSSSPSKNCHLKVQPLDCLSSSAELTDFDDTPVDVNRLLLAHQVKKSMVRSSEVLQTRTPVLTTNLFNRVSLT